MRCYVPFNLIHGRQRRHLLPQEWADAESDDWHEDTFEWKRKMKKPAPQLDIEELSRQAKAGLNPREAVLDSQAKSAEMHMAFATLKTGAVKDKAAAEALGQQWRSLMATDGIMLSLYAIADNELLFTEDGGRILDVRDFVLAQPETAKFRWKDTGEGGASGWKFGRYWSVSRAAFVGEMATLA